jgi:hypothetical protein
MLEIGVAGIRQQSDLPGPFDGLGHLALVLGTVSVYPAGNDLATLGYKVLQGPGLFVIDDQTFV